MLTINNVVDLGFAYKSVIHEDMRNIHVFEKLGHANVCYRPGLALRCEWIITGTLDTFTNKDERIGWITIDCSAAGINSDFKQSWRNYEGPCNNYNDLRTLCRLLNIPIETKNSKKIN